MIHKILFVILFSAISVSALSLPPPNNYIEDYNLDVVNSSFVNSHDSILWDGNSSYWAYGGGFSGSEFGVVSLWNFDHAIGIDSITNDSQGRIATCVNCPSFKTNGEQRVGIGAYDFSGTDDYLSVEDIYLEGEGMSISVWVYPKGFSNGERDSRIIAKADSLARNDQYWTLSTYEHFNYTNGEVRPVFFLKTNDSGLYDGTTRLQADSGNLESWEWAHIAAVFGNGDMSLYFNGELVGSVEKNGSITPNGMIPLQIGNSEGDIDRLWQGLIDELIIFNRSLTSSEISELSQNPPSISGNFVSKPIYTYGFFDSITLDWIESNNGVRIDASFDGGVSWCSLENGVAADSTRCSLPSSELIYRVNYNDSTMLDNLEFEWIHDNSSCGDGQCVIGESCASCSSDCGTCPLEPAIQIYDPINQSVISHNSFMIRFSTYDWNLGGVGAPYVNFYLNSDPSPYSFYNGDTRSVIYDGDVSSLFEWYGEDSIRVHNLPDGSHDLRAVLVSFDGSEMQGILSNDYVSFTLGEGIELSPVNESSSNSSSSITSSESSFTQNNDGLFSGESNCEVSIVKWNELNLNVGDNSSVVIEANDDCNGILNVEIYEKDLFFDDYVTSLSSNFVSPKIFVNWIVGESNDLFGSSEYYAKIKFGGNNNLEVETSEEMLLVVNN